MWVELDKHSTMDSQLLWISFCGLLLVGVNSRLTKELVLSKQVTIDKEHAPEKFAWKDKGIEEVVTVMPTSLNETERDSRGLLKKMGFLAGIKAGGLISSSGTLAASNSLRIFGKVMNTALSVSYGHVDDLDPLPEVQHDSDVKAGEEKEQRLDQTTSQPTLQAIRKSFIKNHNAQVSRVNHKFLRTLGGHLN